jgi:hypothetical protein
MRHPDGREVTSRRTGREHHPEIALMDAVGTRLRRMMEYTRFEDRRNQ